MSKISEPELKKHGLNARDIEIHQKRIKGNLLAEPSKQKTSFLKIIDCFRFDNGGILPARFLKTKPKTVREGFVAFVPAAGAASRYFAPLQDLRQALVDADPEKIRGEIETLVKDGAKSWPLPDALRELLQTDRQKPLPSSFDRAIDEISWPKALLPYALGEKSFLVKKREEHKKMPSLIGEVYVAPLGCSETFAEHLSLLDGKSSSNKAQFLEQGPDLSTLRFTRDGEPYRDETGSLSLVPAGHGMLVRLFPHIQKAWPKAHSLFIRNIDNVIHDEEKALEDTEIFLSQHDFVLGELKKIRLALRANETKKAAELCTSLKGEFPASKQSLPAWTKTLEGDVKTLWSFLFEVFHCPLNLAEQLRRDEGDSKALTKLYDRPFNMLGQVPNNGKDVGGSPVRVMSDGDEIAICLELPHASPGDRKSFLEDPKVATHFNPVFVAAELPEDHSVYELEKCPFWILAEKNIHGTPVVYHEIVLYEVLGNSYTANVLFPEVPRRLFNPHKTLLDGVKGL